MTHSLLFNRFQKILACLALCVGLVVPNALNAALVDLAQVPLATSTSTVVLPNIMFTLDDSGSMSWDFMPDWVGSDYPRSSYSDLYRNSAWNLTYYNPAITYSPPVHFNADGTLNTTTYPSKTSGWNSVKYDAYGILSYNNVPIYPDQLCPDGSTPSGTAPNGACDLTNGKASFYTFVAGEYCTLPNLKVCIAATTPSVTHPYPAQLRWCNSTALTTCQSIKNSTYKFPRYPRSATATVKVDWSNSTNTVSQISVNGQNIMSAAATGSTTESTTATNIRNAINACTAAITGSCTVAGYSATVSSTTVTITAPVGTGAITFLPAVTGGATITRTAFSGGVPGSTIYTSIVSTTPSYPYPGSTSKASTRSDCGSNTTCSYTQEMTNYANWFTYYHTRMSMMKSGVSRAFKSIDNEYRVGFNTINYTGVTDGTRFLRIDKFELGHKNSWYSKLFAANASGSTPLRTSLGKVGRIFANKVSGQQDPMQYSCQQNFSILSTDGYWNGSTVDFSLSSGSVGNLDSDSILRIEGIYEGPTATSNTLADIGKYYYDTDLRTTALGNCTGSLGLDVCVEYDPLSMTSKYQKQYMTSFTIGLGADGTLVYQDDYTTATSGDFNELKLGNLNWSIPCDGCGAQNIDDLWHAAVNGRGEYFSTKNPDQIVKGLEKALEATKAKTGAGAAAATSTLNPTPVDKTAFVASYRNVKWYGNLEGRDINLTTGATSEAALWCVEDVVPQNVCLDPGVLQKDSSTGLWYCVTPGMSVSDCDGAGGTMVGTDCKVEVKISCLGTLKNKVTAITDTRNIFMKNAAGNGLEPFDYTKMTPDQQAFFNSPTGLSQWSTLTAAQQTLASGANLVKYLRGQTGYEDRLINTDKLFRVREATLGDAVESQPIYIGKPRFSYTDSGYDTYKTSATSIAAKTVFLGSNDGMLHAFNAETGEERWAYVPSMVMHKMWKLADKNYASMHTYFVNGSAVTGDIYDGTKWRSILVGSLHGGGRGYYALDVTDPANPVFLWEFTYTQTTDHVLKMDDNVGYSFAEPKIGKRPTDGKWVVFLTSGYNNVSPGNGEGWIYELDPLTGDILHKKSTGVGNTATPSGLAKIEFWADASERDNTAKFIYGGDLQGNLWRLDMSDYSLLNFAVLKDSVGVAQPITTRPELALINEKRVVYAATGKYLEISDLANSQVNTLYAIKDDNATATFTNPRSGSGANEMVQRVFANNGVYRTVSGASIDWTTQRGWYADFPDLGERANVDPQLEYGALLVPTTVPTNTACNPVGYGWVNYVNFETGLSLGGTLDSPTAVRLETPVVGINLVMLPDGKVVASTVEVGKPTPTPADIKFGTISNAFQGKRVIWRELVQ